MATPPQNPNGADNRLTGGYSGTSTAKPLQQASPNRVNVNYQTPKPVTPDRPVNPDMTSEKSQPPTSFSSPSRVVKTYPKQDDNEEVEQTPSEEGTKTKAKSASRGVVRASSKLAGKATGTAAQASGATLQATGKGAELAGKGMRAAGGNLARIGAGMSTTGIGAIAGVPIAAAGAGLTAAGTGTEVAGKATRIAGKGVRRAGKATDQKANQLSMRGVSRVVRGTSKRRASNATAGRLSLQRKIASDPTGKLQMKYARRLTKLAPPVAQIPLKLVLKNAKRAKSVAVTVEIFSWATPLWLMLQFPLAILATVTFVLMGQVDGSLKSLIDFFVEIDGVFIALYGIVFILGLITYISMFFQYTLAGVSCLFGKGALFKFSAFIFGLFFYMLPFFHLFPWFMVWAVAVNKNPS